MRNLSTDLRRECQQSNGQERRRHPHLPTLYYRVQNRRWAEAIRRCRTHPHEAWIQEDISGNTPLHVACRLSPPVDVVRALICAGGEESVAIANAEGATPLHLAASHRCSAAVVETLIRRGRQNSNEGHVHAHDDVNVNDHDNEAHHADNEEDTNAVDPKEEEEKIGAAAAADGNEEDATTIEISPTAILTKMGRSPVHYACMSFRGLDVDAFRILVQATMEATKSSNFGTFNQYHHHHHPDDITAPDDEYLFDHSQNKPLASAQTNIIALRDGTGQTPLALLFRRYRERVRCVIKLIETSIISQQVGGMNFNPYIASTVAAQAVQADLGALWEKARLIVVSMSEYAMRQNHSFRLLDDEENDPLFLEAAAWASKMHYRPDEEEHHLTQPATTPDNGKIFRIVHASVGLTGFGCPPEMIRLAVSIHPSQVREMDEDGNLPLHIAAVASSHCNPSGSDMDEQSLASSLDGASSVLSTFSGWGCASMASTAPANPFDRVIKILLRHYPQAAKIPHGRNGRLPFALAMDAGCRTWDDGMCALLKAYPAALETKSLQLHMYPTILSLAGRPPSSEDPSKHQKGRFLRRGRKGAISNLNAVYGIIRATPQVVDNANNRNILSDK